MTLKKHRKREFKRLLSLGYPRPIAQYVARHDGAGLVRFGYRWVDDLTLGRSTYFNDVRREVVYIYDDGHGGRWESHLIGDEPLSGYVD